MMKMKGASPAPATEPPAPEASGLEAPATEASSTEAPTTDDAASSVAPVDTARRQRRLATKVALAVSVVLVVAAVAVAGVPRDDRGMTRADASPESALDTTSTTAPAATMAATGDIESTLVGIVNQAIAHRTATGTYDGFTATGALVSTSTETVTVSVAAGDLCGFVAVFRGEVGTPQVDPSRSACDQGLVDETGVAARVIDLVAAGFDWSVVNVDMYGRRSLLGFVPTAAGTTLTAASPDGAWAQVAVEHGSACALVVLVPRATDADPLAPAEQVPCQPAG